MATCCECNKKTDAVGFSSNKDKRVTFCEVKNFGSVFISSKYYKNNCSCIADIIAFVKKKIRCEKNHKNYLQTNGGVV